MRVCNTTALVSSDGFAIRWCRRHDSNVRLQAPEARALIQLSYGGKKWWCAQQGPNLRLSG